MSDFKKPGGSKINAPSAPLAPLRMSIPGMSLYRTYICVRLMTVV